jgi:hypothetical protein
MSKQLAKRQLFAVKAEYGLTVPIVLLQQKTSDKIETAHERGLGRKLWEAMLRTECKQAFALAQFRSRGFTGIRHGPSLEEASARRPRQVNASQHSACSSEPVA